MIRFSSRLAAALVAGVLLTGPAFAQEIAPTHLAAARDVVTASGMSRSFEVVIPQFEQRLRQQFVTRPEVAKELDPVFEQLKPEMELQEQAMVNRAAGALARRLDEAELKQIAAFFNSPIGKKYVETQPAVLDDLVKEMQDWSGELAEYIQVRVRAELAKRGLQIQ